MQFKINTIVADDDSLESLKFDNDAEGYFLISALIRYCFWPFVD